MNIRLIVLLGIAAAGAGCGNGDSETPPEAVAAEEEKWDTDAQAGCELATEQEVQAAIGEAVTEKREAGYYGCHWNTASWTIRLEAFADTSLPEDACVEGGTSMPYGKAQSGKRAVTGIGDKALWGGRNLVVCTPRGMIAVGVETSSSSASLDDQKEVAIQLARAALGRLEPGREDGA